MTDVNIATLFQSTWHPKHSVMLQQHKHLCATQEQDSVLLSTAYVVWRCPLLAAQVI